MTKGEDVIEDLPTPVRAALVKVEQPEAAQRKFAAGGFAEFVGEEDLRIVKFR